MVVVDKLRKDDHFILIKSTCKEIDISNILMKEIFILHVISNKIILNRDTKFTSNFWKYLFFGFETKLLFSTDYHPQTNRKRERLNQVLEEILRMHVMHMPKKWENYLPLVEFVYNNDYYKSLNMSPFESLYGRQCNIPISWNNPVEIIKLRPNLLK
jgi:hypothetical protein